jgi:hypothetical protein
MYGYGMSYSASLCLRGYDVDLMFKRKGVIERAKTFCIDTVVVG